jgi:hypothetical protein
MTSNEARVERLEKMFGSRGYGVSAAAAWAAIGSLQEPTRAWSKERAGPALGNCGS